VLAETVHLQDFISVQNNLLHTQWNNDPGAAEGGGSCECTYLLHYALVRRRCATRYYV